MIVRPATEADAPVMAAIYGHNAVHGAGTFEETEPTPEEMASRLAAVLERGLPWVVVEHGGEVAAFAYAGPFRLRRAYRYTAEDSVYVAPEHQGKGYGRAALEAVIAACETIGIRQLIAVIGDSANAGSVGLHRALGFEDRGVLRSVGFKHGRWVDVVMMQKALSGGDGSAPSGHGMPL